MTAELIEKFVESGDVTGKPVTISFKQRNNITGVFVQGHDYTEMKKKNFWRIVSETKLAEWKKSNDMNLARIFNGSEFTKLK
ncbi:MAG: short-chain dehydrogenase [Ferruginibacter sp.]